nr:MAG TPA: hypothetical protein [Caudoviricetes sp.]
MSEHCYSHIFKFYFLDTYHYNRLYNKVKYYFNLFHDIFFVLDFVIFYWYFSTIQKNTFSIHGKMEKYRGFCVWGW